MGSVVLDSNIVFASIIQVPYSLAARTLIGQLADEEIDFPVPGIWEYEIVSALRKFIYSGHLNQEVAFESLKHIFSMGFTTISQTFESHLLALQWAERLGQFVAYDAQYLALAEQIGADFWTADRRLAHIAQENGAAWVHWLGEKN